MARLLISAAHKSSGKTTLSIGLAAALSARGLAVQPFKKGPDYIDPMWLAQASGRACYNLDPHLMHAEEIRVLFARARADADLSLIEGNKGLYDGLALDGSNSNAALAALLEAPVVLVIDAQGMTRGIAPLILGYQAFDRGIRIAGVILNKVGGARHEAKLRAVIEHYTDVPVLGAVHADPALAIVERHLGLVPSNEADGARAHIARLGVAVAAQVDLDRVVAVARDAGALAAPAPAGSEIVVSPTAVSAVALSATAVSAAAARAAPIASRPASRRLADAAPAPRPVRIGVAMDRAFGFYYADDLQALRRAGAELVPFDTLRDRLLPSVDGLFIGGGFPEMCAADLEANVSLRAHLRAEIDAGLPVYAECGGLMYLARHIEIEGHRHAMVGAIPGDVKMHRRPVGRGYVELEPTGEAAWSAAGDGQRLRGHEFHYSSLEALDPEVRFAYRVRRGHGIDGEHDGLIVGNVLASYSHLRSVGDCDWAAAFVDFVCRCAAAPGLPAALMEAARPPRPPLAQTPTQHRGGSPR